MRQRIQYLDSLRGLTMLLVVYSHVVVFLFGKFSDINDVFITFRMPLFFFISGFLSYTLYTKAIIKSRLKNRLLYQLLPTVATSTLFFLFFPMSEKKSLFHVFPGGYWFTYVMVAVFVTYMGVVALLMRFPRLKHTWLIIGLIVTDYVVRQAIVQIFGHDNFVGRDTLWNYLSYAPYFMFGLLCKEHVELFFRCIGKWWVMLAVLGVYLFFYFVKIEEVSLRVMGFLGIIVLFRTFQYFSKIFSYESRLGGMLSTVGKHTLEIYLLHYFFVQLLRPLFRHHKDWRLLIRDSWLWEVGSVTLLSIAIVLLCLGIARIMRKLPALHILFLGRCDIDRKHLLWSR